MITFKMVMYFIYILCTFYFGTLLTVIFLDIPFNRKTVLCIALFSIFCFSTQIIIGLSFSFRAVELYYPIAVHAPLLFMCLFVFKCNLIPSISSLLMCYFLTSPRYLLGLLISKCIPTLPFPDITGRIFATIPLFILVCRFAAAPIKQCFKRSKHDVLILFIPLISIYLASYLLFLYTNLLKTNPIILLEFVYTVFFCFILYYIYIYFHEFDEKVELEKRHQLLELSSTSMKKQFDNIQEKNEETKILRHDIRHFCTLIEQYANENNIAGIHETIHDIKDNIQSVTIKDYCKNKVVNTILSSYLNPFSKDNIDVKIDINVPDKIFVNDTDICVILANILENAYNACKFCKSPFLNLEIKVSSNKLYINVKNSSDVPVSFISGVPVTNKSGHGFGTKSIILLCEKYNGIYSFTNENNIFITKIILHKS